MKGLLLFYLSSGAIRQCVQQASVEVVQLPRLTFISRERTHDRLSLFWTRPHDSGRQRRRVHVDACFREREVTRVVLQWSSVKSAQNSMFCPVGDDRELGSVFHTPAVNCIFNRKPGRRPPHIIGHSVSTLHQGRVGFTALWSISSSKCVAQTESRRASNPSA